MKLISARYLGAISRRDLSPTDRGVRAGTKRTLDQRAPRGKVHPTTTTVSLACAPSRPLDAAIVVAVLARAIPLVTVATLARLAQGRVIASRADDDDDDDFTFLMW